MATRHQADAPPLSRRQRVRRAWGRWPGQVIKLAFSLGVLAALLAVAELDQVLAAMASAHWAGMAAAALVVVLGVVVIQAFEIRHSLAACARPPTLALARINLAMMFYAFFLPSGLTFAIRWTKYRALGLDGWHSAALVGVHKLLQLMVALLFFVAGYLAFPVTSHPAVEALMGALIAALILLMAAFVWLGGAPTRLAASCPSPSRQASHPLMERAARLGQRILGRLQAFRTLAAGDKLRCLLFALCQHLCIVTSAYLVLVAIDPQTPWLAVMMIRSLLVVLLVVPVSVAGIGVRELVFFTLFPFYGVSAEHALAGSLVLLGIQLLIALLGAASELHQQAAHVHDALKVARR